MNWDFGFASLFIIWDIGWAIRDGLTGDWVALGMTIGLTLIMLMVWYMTFGRQKKRWAKKRDLANQPPF